MVTLPRTRQDVVLEEARATVREAAARLDRLTERLAPDLPESVPEFRRARGLLQSALGALRDAGQGGVAVGHADLHVIHHGVQGRPTASALPPRGAWFG